MKVMLSMTASDAFATSTQRSPINICHEIRPLHSQCQPVSSGALIAFIAMYFQRKGEPTMDHNKEHDTGKEHNKEHDPGKEHQKEKDPGTGYNKGKDPGTAHLKNNTPKDTGKH
jgi:hypothetical protein